LSPASAGAFLLERRIAKNVSDMPWKEPVAEALDHDVEALKNWLRGEWRHVADPSITRLERGQLREYMKQADVIARACNSWRQKKLATTRPDF
jgi:hypothetical protein